MRFAGPLPVVRVCHIQWLKTTSSASSYGVQRLCMTKLLSLSSFLLFKKINSICLLILYSAQPSFAGTDCYILPKDCSKQVTRGERHLFLL